MTRGRYEELLTHNDDHPGFLSPTAIGVVQRKIADARQLLSLMSQTDAAGAPVQPEANGAPRNGGTGDASRPNFWEGLFGGGGDEDGNQSLTGALGCCTNRNKVPSNHVPSFSAQRAASAKGLDSAAEPHGQDKAGLFGGLFGNGGAKVAL